MCVCVCVCSNDQGTESRQKLVTQQQYHIRYICVKVKYVININKYMYIHISTYISIYMYII